MNNNKEVKFPELMTQKDLTSYLGKSDAWAERGRLEGYGPPYIKIGRSIRYVATDVLNWLEANRRKSTSKNTEEYKAGGNR